MIKKAAVVFLVLIIIMLVFRLSLIQAQRYKDESDSFPKEDTVLLEEKLDKILSLLSDKGNQERSNREISAKLDQVLLNQQKILNELDVVKVRATRK